MTRDRLRVGMLLGALPADVSHLEIAAQDVDLTLYHSDWVQPGGATPDVGGPPPSAAGVRTFTPVPRSHRGHLAWTYPGLGTALDRDRPDVLHVVSEPWGLLALQAARWARTAPQTTLVLHGCDTLWHHGRPLKQRLRRKVIPYVLGRTDAFVAENGLALALARSNGLPETAYTERMHTNPRDARTFRIPAASARTAARAVLGVETDDVAVALLGRLVPQKGVRVYLDAADRLVADGVPARFFVAGDGPLADEVSARARGRVVALGKLAYPDGVLGLLRAADVLACPSTPMPTWEDQGPRVVLEAMMCGAVPVGTRTGGIPEMLGGHGMLAEPADVDDLATALRSAVDLARDGALRARISAWAHDTYSADAVGRRMAELWRSLSGRARPVGRI